MSASDPDHANVLFRPPLLYLVSMLAGGGVHAVVPIGLLPWSVALPLGAIATGCAVALFLAASGRFRRAGTTIPTDEPTTAIVRDGPYRYTRNPIYVALSLLHVGVALFVNSAWLIGTLAVTLILLTVGVIRREERYLERKFGDEYTAYKRSVRRWL